jgi:hypothetical protein
MASKDQDHLQSCISAAPPKGNVKLGGYVVMAEWVENDGQKLLTRLIGDSTSSWAAKGYLHEGLYSTWPANPEHHNPGHSGEWTIMESASLTDPDS